MVGGSDFKLGESDEGMADVPRAREARARGPTREVCLRIVHNRDAQEGIGNMEHRPPAQCRDKPGGMLDRNLQGKIGCLLRDIFADVAEAPVPERFVKLLEALAAKEESW